MEEKETKKVEVKEDKTKKAETQKAETKKNETKKVETKTDAKVKKEGDNKKSNSGIIVAVVIVVLVLIALVAYCIFMADSPKRAVETMFNDAKMNNFTQSVLAKLTEEDLINQEAQKAMFSNLSWKITKEEKQDENTATVEVEVTNKDFKTIIGNFKNKIIKAAINGESIDEAKTEEYLIAEMNNSEIENVTNTHNIVVKKQDGKWQVSEEDNDIDNILLPGFYETLED